ncbi:glycosyl hydrolase, family 3 [Candidatus Vecturithrix granuli]|uniref:Glycosyl hydrolase, family 3 n=1 Tax=Vecturithrix granuli TaxID=1499967 RepID=A0A0S6WAF4_VECG1|nr:glycosyl hydrolase, family 3 [Candidatus Vecturithrix granuli]
MITELEHKIGQMLLIGFRGLELRDDNPIIEDIRTRHLGGVVLFDYDVCTQTPARNIHSPEQVQRLIASLQDIAVEPLFIGIDQEGGKVNRLKERYGFPPSVSAQYLGDLDLVEVTGKHAELTAKTLAELGMNLNFAPDVDLNIYPDNPIIGKVERSFSADPDVVIRHAREWIACHHAQGVLCALKHFPGHGSSRQDTHLGFVDVTDTWSANELRPYQDLLYSGFHDMVMTAHIFNARLDPEFPATLSYKMITGILREQLGYDGVVISDDMQMKAIAEQYPLETAIQSALEAGVDILTFGNNLNYNGNIMMQVVTIISQLVRQGTISEKRIDESHQRILRLKARLQT